MRSSFVEIFQGVLSCCYKNLFKDFIFFIRGGVMRFYAEVEFFLLLQIYENWGRGALVIARNYSFRVQL